MYGIQSQERRYHYSGIAVPVCWNSSAIPAGIFTGEAPEPVKFRYITYDRKVYTIKVGKVVDLQREFVGQVKNYIYQCKSLIDRRERKYELKYEAADSTWLLVRIE